MSTGACAFNRPRSSSLDPFIDSSFSVDPSIFSPSKGHVKRNKEFGQSEDTSYLVIGGGEVRKEQDYANYQGEDNKVNKINNISSTGKEKSGFVSSFRNSQMRSDKPETSSNSTTFTVAPSVSSSSSSSAPASTAPLSPISMDCDLKSPSSVHDSTISRLIDAVSLGNEQETCGSISALIGQFESTANQSDLTTISHDKTPFCRSNFKPTTPKALQVLSSPHKTNTASINKKLLTSPQKVPLRTNYVDQEKLSQADPPACGVLSSPETAELEEVYTILDEEVLSPISAYNMKKKTVFVQADTTESTTSNSFRLSPVKVKDHCLGKEQIVGCNNMHKRSGGSEDIEEAEEGVYEEVYDPPEPELGTSKSYIGSFVNNECVQFLHDPVGNVFSEVEINVDEGPLDMMSTSPRHASQWEELISPTKRHAIYQNHESTPNYSKQKQPSSFCDYQQECLQHACRGAFSQCLSPVGHQLSSYHQHQNKFQPSPLHRLANSRPSNPSPVRQNSCPVPQRNSEAFTNSRDFNTSYMQQKSYGRNHILNRAHQDNPRYKEMEREQERCSYNVFLSFESLPGQSAVSLNSCRDRGLYSPSSDCDAVYSQFDYCLTPQPEPSASQNTKLHCQSQSQSPTPKQSWNQKLSLNNTGHQSQPESSLSLQSNEGPLSTTSLSCTIDTEAPSPCKSKSLGDLTSEDISCNFQSKYHIISRSFITPHMRKQRRKGTMGEGTFQSQSCDPLTEQLRKLVSLEGDDSDRERPQPLQLQLEAKSPLSQPQLTSMGSVVHRDVDDSPPLLTRRLSSRSQSRVRHINSRARERQQEALKSRTGVMINSATSIGGVVLRNKSTSPNPIANRHSTGSYIAGYLGQLEDRGLPEGACTSLRNGNGDHYRDRYYTDDSIPPAESNHSASEPEVYFLLRL